MLKEGDEDVFRRVDFPNDLRWERVREEDGVDRRVCGMGSLVRKRVQLRYYAKDFFNHIYCQPMIAFVKTTPPHPHTD